MSCISKQLRGFRLNITPISMFHFIADYRYISQYIIDIMKITMNKVNIQIIKMLAIFIQITGIVSNIVL